MKRGIVLATVAICLVIASVGVANAATLPSPPFTTNASCQQCHDVNAGGPTTSKTDFAVGIDYSKCNACHWPSISSPLPGGTFADHGHATMFGGECTTGGCHASGASNGSLPYWQAPFGGWFTSPASLSLTPAQIHAIHSTDGWMTQHPALGDNGLEFCKGCHYKAGCTMCHTPSANHGAHSQTMASTVASFAPVTMTTGAGFPEGSPATLVNVVTAPVTCVAAACHTLTPVIPNCTSCHPEKQDIHGYETGLHTADVATNTLAGTTATCGDCHQMDLYPEHQRTGASSAAAGCGNCHPTPRDSFVSWDHTCQTGGCHPASTAAAPHANQDASHTPAASAEAVCGACHPGRLDQIHANATSSVDPAKTSCLVCHDNGSLPKSNDCTVCHFTFEQHYSVTKHTTTWDLSNCSSAGCHTKTDLMGIHQEHNAAFACVGCHTSTDANVQNAISNGVTACDACHAGITQAQGHYAIHWSSPLLVSGTPPVGNYSYYTGSTGTAPTKDCALCHTSNLMDEHLGMKDPATGNWIRVPRTDSSGNALTCASCHSSLDNNVRTAIASGLTNCDACHAVHGPISTIHASTYADNPPVNCANCHASDVSAVHAGVSVTTPSGATLSGCDVCHSYFEGTRGAAVQAAISAGDTRCTTCHGTTHPDLGSHTASSAASLTDCGQCHGTGSSTSIDIQQVHANASLGACNVCHSNTGRVPDITQKTAECASCHTTQGTDYHRTMAASHVSNQTACAGSSCHAIGDLTALHSNATTTVAGITYTGCSVCHQSPTHQPTSSDCYTCHAGHGDLTVAHTAPSSSACVACHDTADVRAIHANDPLGGCNVCHNNPTRVPTLPATTDCVNCHSSLSPADPNHYPAASHAATDGTESGLACSACHKLDMKAEHFKPSSGPVSCVQCHQTKVSTFTAPWDQTCSACHATRHAGKAAMHTSSTTACSGDTGCHNISDVSVIHSNATTTVAGVTYSGCQVCHRNSDAPPTTTTCTDCHGAPHGDINAKHAATNSASCAQCHAVGDVRPIHAARSEGPCDVCHNNPSRVPDITQKTADCGSCHPTAIPSHTGYTASHTSTQTACAGSGCHVIGDLTALHSNATTTVAGVTYNGCGVCHQSPAKQPTTSDCMASGCHGTANPHPAHLAANSAGCQSAGCHTSNDLVTLHANRPEGGCSVCHANPTGGDLTAGKTAFDCAQSGCHADKSPTNPNHYPAANHTPAAMTSTASAGGTASAKCSDCHSTAAASGPQQLYAQHQGLPDGLAGTSCTDCHGFSASVTAVVSASWPTKACDACHNSAAMPSNVQHGVAVPMVSGSSPTDGCGASGTGCHSTYDLHALHKNAAGCNLSDPNGGSCHDFTKQAAKPTAKTCGTGGTCHKTSNPHVAHLATSSQNCVSNGCHGTNDLTVLHTNRPEGKCAVCHNNPTGGDLTAGKTTFDCGQSGCHLGVTPGHMAQHEASGTVVSGGGTFAASGCDGCHYTNLIGEHITSGLKAASTSATMTCDTCHASTNAAVVAAIASGDVSCDACHPTVNGRDTHADQWNTEFVAGQSAVHRVNSGLPGVRTSYVINGATYTWSLPSSGWLKSPWTTTSVVSCDNCHSFSGTASGPHGSAVTVNIDPNYSLDWQSAALGGSSYSGWGGSGSGTTGSSSVICDKCHNYSNSNNVHTEGDHSHEKCVVCHTGVPHGWRLPRMLAYTTDPAPYNSTGLVKIRLANHSSNWSESDCQSSCGEHGSMSGSAWPSTAPATYGTATGYVKTTGGVAVSGATVSSDQGQTATTDATGKYTLSSVPTGTRQITAAATGYVTQTSSATLNNDQTTTVNFTLSKPGTISGSVADATTAAKLSGVTVSVSGGPSATTDVNGAYSLAGLAAGTYSLTYAKTGYTSQTVSVVVTAGGTTAQNVALVSVYGTIKGTVTDSASAAKLSGVAVSVSGGASTSTDSNGAYTLSNVTAGTYSVTFSKAGYTSQTISVVVTGGGATTQNVALVLTPASSNVAKGKTFTASSIGSSSYSADHAGDGSYSTYWQSQSISYSNKTQWLQVDLGTATSIAKVVVGWNGTSNYASAYQVQYSNTGSTWTTVNNGTVTSGSSSSKTFTFSAVSARYWRVYMTNNNSGNPYRIYELETWTP